MQQILLQREPQPIDFYSVGRNLCHGPVLFPSSEGEVVLHRDELGPDLLQGGL